MLLWVQTLIWFLLSWFPMLGLSYWHQDSFFSLWFFVTTFMLVVLWIIKMYGFSFYDSSERPISSFHAYGYLLLIWLSIALLAQVPWFCYGGFDLIDVWFSSVSAITTTGAEVFTSLEAIPKTLLVYRLYLQFLGGLGLVMMFLLFLPWSQGWHISSMRMDMPGPFSHHSLGENIFVVGRLLWIIYFGLWFFCGLCFWLLGLDVIDAFAEAFGVVATGGFSLHFDGLVHYGFSVQTVSVVFMLLGSLSFLSHVAFFKTRNFLVYLHHGEHQWFFAIFGFFVGFSGVLYYFFDGDFFQILFWSVSFLTTSGYAFEPLLSPPLLLLFFWLLACFVGGSVGSTSGGIKQGRLRFYFLESLQAVKVLLHPNMVSNSVSQMRTDHLYHHSESKSLPLVMSGFLFFYLFIFALSMMFLLLLGHSFSTAFGSTLACMSNTGLPIFDMGGYGSFDFFTKLILTVDMLLGRLEILPIMVWCYRFLSGRG